jgi:hypothetical protein
VTGAARPDFEEFVAACGPRLSGTRELLGWRAVGSAAPDWVFNVAVCLNRPSDATLRQVESVLGSISFGGSTG